MTEEHHRLELELTEVAGSRRSIRERVELSGIRPGAALEGQLLGLDLESLENEAARVSSLEAIGPVNALAVEEHSEETKRYEFLVTQRDDLVAARQSLLQAIREIDGTAKTMFLETFNAIQQHFVTVFQTLFGGGECELRLAVPDDPLESEIEIHAAPRGKRTQRIHLLSSGERTLVATSLLFAIYLTKPSPFCLMDEVDALPDDANVGRFTTCSMIQEQDQFLVITHNRDHAGGRRGVRRDDAGTCPHHRGCAPRRAGSPSLMRRAQSTKSTAQRAAVSLPARGSAHGLPGLALACIGVALLHAQTRKRSRSRPAAPSARFSFRASFEQIIEDRMIGTESKGEWCTG
jgi:hypothetical protein